jgi:prepilin-type N-terminal cleavage/methylation domain-containing protein
MSRSNSSDGFTLLELLSVVTLLSICAALAAPVFRGSLERIRARTALDGVVGYLYRTRMLAVREGGPVQLVMVADRDGCTRLLRIERKVGTRPGAVSNSHLDLPGLCLRYTGDSIVAFDGRGMLRPPTRSFYIGRGAESDSVVISIAGWVRRSYRRRRRLEKIAGSGEFLPGRSGIRRCKAPHRRALNGAGGAVSPRAYFRACCPHPRRAAAATGGGEPPGARAAAPATVSVRTGAAVGGFSLIEVMVAMVILSFGIMALQSVMMTAIRSMAMAERQASFAAHAADSLESALYSLRSGTPTSQFCVSLPPFGDQLSRRISVEDNVATVSVAVIPSRSEGPYPPRPLELASSIFLPAFAGTAAGTACS